MWDVLGFCSAGYIYTSHKKFSEGKQAHVGMETLKTNQTRWESMIPQHFHTLCHFAATYTICCVSCVQRRVVEGSGVGSGGCSAF